VGDRGSGPAARVRELSGSVRVRTTAASVVVVGAALVVAAVAMVLLLRRTLTTDVRTSARLRAEAVADGFVQGGQRRVIAVGDQEEEFVQVLDAEGRVVASSMNLVGRGAVARLAAGDSRRLEGLPFEEEDPFLAVATPASTPGGRLTVVVGRSLETVTESSHAVVGLLVIGVPLLIFVVGTVTWRVVGRALAPVEAMRAEVDGISTGELHRRVPDPPGGDEISRLAATMNRMLTRLEHGQIRQRRFVSDASHELRSPVASIRQHAEVALSHPEITSSNELAEVVLQEDARLQHLVDDLLLLAKLDEGTLRLRMERVELDELLLHEAERLRSTTDLLVETGGVSTSSVLGDRRQLDRLVRNLSDNAARHAHGRVVLSVTDGEAGSTLDVDDDGDGIPSSERERIFERFVRLDEARDRDSGGSGLGLALVREIATAHGATVEVLDSPLGGSRFEVRFPAAT
jgi:signal transduction histidine kinase